MKTKLLSLFVALIATSTLWASSVITYTAASKLSETTSTGITITIGLHVNAFNTTISSHTFFNGTGTITFASEVTTIGDWAFHYCKGLTSITIPNSVTAIGENAFRSCSGLTSVTIPNSVTTIGNSAFSGCSGLTSVTIPSSVTAIGDCAFAWCSGLTSINVDAANTHYASIDGVLFNYAKDTLIQYPIGNTRSLYTIPSSITTIGNDAFYECTGLTSVTIPNSVTSIGWCAFRSCSGLTSVTIPNSVTTIGDWAFYGCSGLTSVTIGNSVTTIGEYAFVGCSGLTSVTLNSNTICNFYRMNETFGAQVTEYIIGDSVTTIGDYAFKGCSGLTSVTIPNSVTVIGNDAFKDCSSIQSVTWNAKNCNGYNFGSQVESFVFGDSVEVIPNDICKGMNKLLTIIIPNSVTTIGEYAFRACSGLTSVTIPNSVTSIGWCAFYDCSSIQSVTWNAKNCNGYNFGSQVESFVFGDSVEVIPNDICKGMNKLLTITIPNSVTMIGGSAFSNCSGLTSINVDAANTHYASIDGVLFNLAQDTLIQYPIGNTQTAYTIPNSVTTIGEYAFYGCSGLTSVTIPNSVTVIGNDAFKDCSSIQSVTWNAKNCNGYNFGSQVESFVFGDSVEVIPNDICKGMNKLSTITIPNSVTMIGGSAFSDCSGLTSVTIPNSVTTIGRSAFENCSGLTSVTIPNSVTTIEGSAFYNCSGLTSVTIPNSVTTIEGSAFYLVNNIVYNGTATGSPWGAKCVNGYIDGYFVYSNTTKTTLCACLSAATGEITISNTVTTIGDNAFRDCTGLTSVTIPNSVTMIGDYAFSGCSGLPVIDNIRYADTYLVEAVDKSLDTYNIQDGTKWIGSSAFEGCKLTSIVIPNSVTTIGDYAFRYCWELTDITLPNSVTTIGYWAFGVCEYLTRTNYIGTIADWCKIKFESALSNPFTYSHTFYINGVEIKDLVIPEGIDTIGDYTFRGCSGLTSVTIPNSVTTIGDYAFYWCSSLTSVTIPNSVTTIGDYAFAAANNTTYLTDVVIGANVTEIGCNAFANDYRLENITCYAPIAPNVCSTTFGNLDKSVIYLYVPADYQRAYQEDSDWKDFDLHLIGAKQQPISTDTIIVKPSADNATFTWPANEQADSYLLEITKDGVVFCTLTFNAIGQLTGIAFVPSRDGEAHTMAAATMTAAGWQFTVTGLNQASKYAYTLDVTDAQQQSIKTYTGVFVTDGYTDLEAVEGSQFTDSPVHQFTKYVKDGRLLIERNGIRYSVQGTKIK